MAHLLARLGENVGDGRRCIHYRGGDHVDAVAQSVAAAADGSVVLVEGQGPPWDRPVRVDLRSWPGDLPAPEELWSRRQATETADLIHEVVIAGQWVGDPRGVPCELGRTRAGLIVLNYAGWRLLDFPPGPIAVIPCRAAERVVWVVPPSSVPAPREDRDDDDLGLLPPVVLTAPTPASHRVSTPAWVFTPPTQTRLAAFRPGRQPPTRPRRAPRDVRARVPFRDLTFEDRSVWVHLNGRKYRVAAPSSRSVYNALRSGLDQERPDGVEVNGTLYDGGHYEFDVVGLCPSGGGARTLDHMQTARARARRG